MSPTRPSYHHGDLRAALVHAADTIVAEEGLEGFSLRAAAARVGVSPGAPAHHFGSARGLLTEVALLAFARLGDALEAVGRSDDPATDLRALGLAFVTFATDHPGHFRLMFRNDLIERGDPRYATVSMRPAERLGLAIAAYEGRPALHLGRFEDAADLFGALATLHGLAHMAISEKALPFFGSPDARVFVARDLPRVLERLYPSRP